jgi:type III restriction enzyme
MRFQLTGYQTDASQEVISALQEGFDRYDKAKKSTAVSLSAPTGAGKTVIATSVIEEFFFGSENHTPIPETTFLWVTDDPSLNQQTKRKMLQASSLLQPSHLVAIDQSFDQQMLTEGKVYFVHIQQLGKGATNYVQISDKRQYSIWDTIRNTIANRGNRFVLIVDEAHRGTSTKTGSKSITASLMDGTDGAFPASPVVLGISATPKRFVDAISKSGQRILDPVGVDIDAVRESGLIKDKIRIRHPHEAQAGDATLLALAVNDLKNYDQNWAEYSREQSEPAVTPALVVQIKANTSPEEISGILDLLKSEWPILEGKSIGHSFQDHTTLIAGEKRVRYIAPQDIQDDPNLRVVLFKEALTTGWDCPRAEVMFSYRTAQDSTYIAQLIGRMVRTPLARRVSTNDYLNTVALYLPHYDDSQVGQVVAGLQSDDESITTAVELESITCGRNPNIPDEVWGAIQKLPTYTRPAKHHRNDVARLNALATLLVGNQIDTNAMSTARQHIVDTLKREQNRLADTVKDSIADLEQLEFQTQSIDLASGAVEREIAYLPINARNIDDLFNQARRTLGDASAKWYWDYLCDQDEHPETAKIIVAALARDASVPQSLEGSAKTLIDTWRKQYNAEIGKLPDAKRAAFYTIWQQSKMPEQVQIILPSLVTVSEASQAFEKHLYSDENNVYPAKLTGWEEDVLKTEISREKSLLAWYRNPTGGTAALAVPYEESGLHRTMYPDFLFAHEADGSVVIDVVDPHRPDAADTGPKWRGLAAYAESHKDSVRRCLGVIRGTSGSMLSLDLKNPAVVSRLQSVNNENDIRTLFDDLGGAY